MASPSGRPATAVPANTIWNGPGDHHRARDVPPRRDLPTRSTATTTSPALSARASQSCFFSNLGLLYTVNPDPQRPTCIWVNSDNGTQQIQNFDAYTGGPCGEGPVRVLAAGIIAPSEQCIPANYTSLQVTVPARSSYTSGSVQFEDFDGNPIPSIPTQNLDSTGSVNLAPLDPGHGEPAAPVPDHAQRGRVAAGGRCHADLDGHLLGRLRDRRPDGHRYPGVPTGCLRRRGVLLRSTPGSTDPWAATTSTSPWWDGRHARRPGYWLVASDGGVFAFGDAGSTARWGRPHLNAPMVGMAPTPDGKGYWLVAADGGVFAFGDAALLRLHGRRAHLNAGAWGSRPPRRATATGWSAADGGVFAFGDATFYGSMGGQHLDAPVVGIASTADGKGYWLVAADGGVFAFGDAGFDGSMGGKHLNGPWSGSSPRRAATATGWWPPTAASSPSATPPSTAAGGHAVNALPVAPTS